jgi:hypothetical protein
VDVSSLPPNSPLVPDYSRSYKDPSIKAFSSGKTFPGATNDITNPFAFLKGFRTREYAANQYNTANYWAGNFKFKTSDADVKTRGPLTSLIRLFKTRTAETRTAPAAGKTFGTRPAPLVAEKRNEVFRGKIQGELDKQGPNAVKNHDPLQEKDGAITGGGGRGDTQPHVVDTESGLHTMTVDEVRDLLDKTK